MEKIQTKRKLRIVGVSSLLCGLLLAALFWGCHKLGSTGVGKLVPADIPMLGLRLEIVDASGKPLGPDRSLLKSRAQQTAQSFPGPQAAPAGPPPQCEQLRGGDGDYKPRGDYAGKVFAPGCSAEASWKVIHHPVSVTLYFDQGENRRHALLQWLSASPAAKKFTASRVVQGLFYDPLQAASVRGEDLKLDGLRGALLRRLVEEALSAQAELHYDVVHGDKGFVFSFIRGRCPFASRALPLAARKLARSGYRVEGLREPVVEMRIGRQRLFVAEFGERVYLANGLEALLNVIDNLPLVREGGAAAPLVLVLRGEAFFKELMPYLIGSPSWPVEFAFALDPADRELGELRLGRAKFLEHLRPKIFPGVLAAVPHDAFAAAAGSFRFPAEMTAEDWNRFLVEGIGFPREKDPQEDAAEAGVGLVWDISAANPERMSEIGLSISRPAGAPPPEQYRRFLAPSMFSAECGGGTVFLAATSEDLLQRMRESCEGQSRSVLALPGAQAAGPLAEAQLALLLNPGSALAELFAAGQPADFNEQESAAAEPEWKKQYRRAVQALREESGRLFDELPVFAYAGAAPEDGQPTLVLRGLIFGRNGLKSGSK